MASALASGFGCGANATHQISISAAIFNTTMANSSTVNRRKGRCGARVSSAGELDAMELDMRRFRAVDGLKHTPEAGGG